MAPVSVLLMLPSTMVMPVVSAVTLKLPLAPVLIEAFWFTVSPVIRMLPLLLVISALRSMMPMEMEFTKYQRITETILVLMELHLENSIILDQTQMAVKETIVQIF